MKNMWNFVKGAGWVLSMIVSFIAGVALTAKGSKELDRWMKLNAKAPKQKPVEKSTMGFQSQLR